MGNRGRLRAAVSVCVARESRLQWASVGVAVAIAAGSAAVSAADGDSDGSSVYADTIAVSQTPADVEQPKRATDAVELEEIVVIGEKVGRTVAQTTSSVAVTTAQSAADYGDDSVSDVVNRTANASVGIEGDISLRGVDAGGAEGYGSGQPVISTYIDGIAIDPIGQGGNVLDIFDVEQVEVLRGAQSTSQGRNALAGAVVVNTRDPTDYWDLNARMRLAELTEREYALAGGGPLGAGFAFRLVGDYHSDDGFIRNVTLDDPDWNKKEDALLRGKLAWRPTFAPDFDALLTVGYTHRTGGLHELNREADSDGDSAHRESKDNVAGYAHQHSLPASLRLRYAFNETFELTSTTGMIRSGSKQLNDYDGTAQDNGYYKYDQIGRTLTEELRLNVRDWHGFTGLIGLYGGHYRDSFDYPAYNLMVRCPKWRRFRWSAIWSRRVSISICRTAIAPTIWPRSPISITRSPTA
jgi:iron complex outermembrane receptor protein